MKINPFSVYPIPATTRLGEQVGVSHLVSLRDGVLAITRLPCGKSSSGWLRDLRVSDRPLLEELAMFARVRLEACDE